MKNLRLAHPKKMDEAVPGHLKCGRAETDPAAAEAPIGAPLKYTFAGIWEIDPLGLEEHAQAIQILDVREPGEFEGPLGHIRGARLIALVDFDERSGELGRDRPVVAVCRAGSRSAQATVILREAGFSDVA